MDKRAVMIGAASFLAGFVVALATGSFADNEPGHSNLRLEALGGKCKYHNGQDGQWRKDNYATDLSLLTTCGSLGVSQTLWATPAGFLGYRVAYVDFGMASARTNVPARDDEANTYPSGQQCDQATLSKCVGEYHQWGRARGLTLGALLENPTKYGTFGVEGGGFVFQSYWRVQGTVPGPGTCDACTNPATFDWNGAKGMHTTWYVGLTYTYSHLFLQVRKYHSIYASQSSKTNSPLDIGLIGGPFKSVMAGFQWEL